MTKTIVVPMGRSARDVDAVLQAQFLAAGLHADVAIVHSTDLRQETDDDAPVPRALAQTVPDPLLCTTVDDELDAAGEGDTSAHRGMADIISDEGVPVVLLGRRAHPVDPAAHDFRWNLQPSHGGRYTDQTVSEQVGQILLCWDGTTRLFRLEPLVVDWATAFDLEVSIVTVRSPADPPLPISPAVGLIDQQEQIAERMRAHGLVVHVHVLHGSDPAEEILRLAGTLPTKLIAALTGDRGVCNKIVHDSQWPVLIQRASASSRVERFGTAAITARVSDVRGSTAASRPAVDRSVAYDQVEPPCEH